MKTFGRWIARAMSMRFEHGAGGARIHISAACFLLPTLLAVGLLIYPGGCATTGIGNGSHAAPMMRVCIVQQADAVTIEAARPPAYTTTSDQTTRTLNLNRSASYPLRLTQQGWMIGGTMIGAGELVLTPADAESLKVGPALDDNKPHRFRGTIHFVPTGGGKFDVVNYVNLEDYLKGVLPKEIPSTWPAETQKAQAITARTYALYEKNWNDQVLHSARHFDLYSSQSSQVYGGFDAENDVSRRAVDETPGIVLASGPEGQERIFKAYFSSCCGGITQSATDAFNDPYCEALADQNARSLCSGSKYFNWGPIVIPKSELTRRFRQWGAKRDRPEKNIEFITRVEVDAINHSGRPVRFKVTDRNGTAYSMTGEELRWATNTTDANDGTKLLSSFVSIINDSNAIQFVDGHGFGHGVGLCQYCAEARGRAGLAYPDILRAAFPKTKLLMAY